MVTIDFFADLLRDAYYAGQQMAMNGDACPSRDEVADLFHDQIFSTTGTYVDHVENTTSVYYMSHGLAHEYETTTDAVWSSFQEGYTDAVDLAS